MLIIHIFQERVASLVYSCFSQFDYEGGGGGGWYSSNIWVEVSRWGFEILTLFRTKPSCLGHIILSKTGHTVFRDRFAQNCIPCVGQDENHSLSSGTSPYWSYKGVPLPRALPHRLSKRQSLSTTFPIQDYIYLDNHSPLYLRNDSWVKAIHSATLSP